MSSHFSGVKRLFTNHGPFVGRQRIIHLMNGGANYSKFKRFAVVLAAIAFLYVALGIWNILTTPILGVMFCTTHIDP
jgi:hypothetical protein